MKRPTTSPPSSTASPQATVPSGRATSCQAKSLADVLLSLLATCISSLNEAGQKWTGTLAFSAAHSRTEMAERSAPSAAGHLSSLGLRPLILSAASLGSANSSSSRLTKSPPALSTSSMTLLTHSSRPGPMGTSAPTLMPVSLLASLRPSTYLGETGWNLISSRPALHSATRASGVA